jgi:hypothetical protein
VVKFFNNSNTPAQYPLSQEKKIIKCSCALIKWNYMNKNKREIENTYSSIVRLLLCWMAKVSIICLKSIVKSVSIANKDKPLNPLLDIRLRRLVLMCFVLMKVCSVVADETRTVGNPCCHDESSKYKLIMSFYFDCFSIGFNTWIPLDNNRISHFNSIHKSLIRPSLKILNYLVIKMKSRENFSQSFLKMDCSFQWE